MMCTRNPIAQKPASFECSRVSYSDPFIKPKQNPPSDTRDFYSLSVRLLAQHLMTKNNMILLL